MKQCEWQPMVLLLQESCLMGDVDCQRYLQAIQDVWERQAHVDQDGDC